MKIYQCEEGEEEVNHTYFQKELLLNTGEEEDERRKLAGGRTTDASEDAQEEELEAGEKSNQSAAKDESGGLVTIAISGLVGGAMKLCQQGFGMWHAAVEGSVVIRGSIF